MTGATLTIDTSSALGETTKLLRRISNPQPLFAEYGEVLLRSTQQRFKDQVDPSGLAWKPISEAWEKWKEYNKKSTKILIMDGYLSKLMRYYASPTELLFGSDRPYAAIHQFGGEIKRPSRTKEVFFKRDKDGNVGNRFVKRKNSDFAQTVNVGAYTIRIPQRPFLGISKSDNEELLAVTNDYLVRD